MKDRKKKKKQSVSTTPRPASLTSIHDCPVDPANPEFMLEENVHDQSEGGENEHHKTVITHLISQLKIGMDLTKVTLPTFILEKRSLLEFYADLFAYPELFVDISRKTTPQARMLACVKFYLATFSAGRDSTVCKKPYNPILGEYFRCFYHLVNNKNTTSYDSDVTASSADLQKNGPLHWMDEDDLCFISEQVSHHPPVSACYAIHHEQDISYQGHIWTKSKFYGLSVGVEMIGPGVVKLSKLDEQYDFVYPSVVYRSILTIPWAEISGDTFISCNKTGYNAKIKFHPKPFYRGHPHRVTAEIFCKPSKTPICTIDGKWDDVLYIQFPDGKREVFFDKSKFTRSPKRVRKLSDQDSQESRRLWFDVTQSLLSRNVEDATRYKSQLEQKQREEAATREKNGVKYQPQFFTLNGNNWIYKFSGNSTIIPQLPQPEVTPSTSSQTKKKKS